MTGIVGAREVVPEFVLLTGSLGSGKTTLLCDYLSLPESADTGVIVNEAGEINVDGAIVLSGRRDLPMTLLGNGCVCCSLGDDLHSAIDELLAVRHQSDAADFSRIVLETSGGPIEADRVVTCAGLYADEVARAVSGPDGAAGLRIVAFRGEYRELVPARAHCPASTEVNSITMNSSTRFSARPIS